MKRISMKNFIELISEGYSSLDGRSKGIEGLLLSDPKTKCIVTTKTILNEEWDFKSYEFIADSAKESEKVLIVVVRDSGLYLLGDDAQSESNCVEDKQNGSRKIETVYRQLSKWEMKTIKGIYAIYKSVSEGGLAGVRSNVSVVSYKIVPEVFTPVFKSDRTLQEHLSANKVIVYSMRDLFGYIELLREVKPYSYYKFKYLLNII